MRTLVFVFWSLLWSSAAIGAIQAPVAAVEASVDSVFAHAELLLRQGAPDSVLAIVNPVVERARAASEGKVELRGMLHQAGALALSGRLQEAEQVSRQARELALQGNNAPSARMASRWLGYSLLAQGRSDEATSTYRQLIDEATTAGDLREEAYAQMGLAYLALRRNETAAARLGYERAAPLFGKIGEKAMELDCLVGLARTLEKEGHFQEMQQLYERVLHEGEQTGSRRVVGFALTNLGTYEYQSGDPSRAIDYWERVLKEKLLGGDLAAAVTPQMNLALAQMELGAFDEAAVELKQLHQRCLDGGFLDRDAAVLGVMAGIEQARGNPAGAETIRRRIMGLAGAPNDERLDAALQIMQGLVKDDAPAHALAFGDTVSATMFSGATAQQRNEFNLWVATALLAVNRPAEALPLAAGAAAEANQAGFRQDELAALLVTARCERALAAAAGAPADSALTRLRQARQRWEDLRSLPRDPQWREQRGSLGSAIHLELASLLLEEPRAMDEPGRVRAAFDALQGYKARSLLERMLGPDGFKPGSTSAGPPTSLTQLQNGILQPGEVLLDIYLSEERSLMFAVTMTSCRAVTLPTEGVLKNHVRLFLDLVSSPPSGDERAFDYLPAADQMSSEIFGAVAADLQTANRLIIAADGVLNRLPFEMLLPDTERGLEVMRLPSATVLTQLRGRPLDEGAKGVLVLQSSDQPGTESLPGALAEIRALRRDFREVLVLQPGCTAGSGDWVENLTARAILHIPNHTETFDQRPWNSRIALGQTEDGSACWLESSEIVAMRLDAELAVLSGCSSAGGRVLSGEGVVGLTGAFLAAGTRAIVASLWDMDDAATAVFMDHFYQELSRGGTAAGALAIARKKMAADKGTASPCYWAGFVIVGDGSLPVPLERRASVGSGLIAGGIGMVVLVGALALRKKLVIFIRNRSL